MHLCPLVKVNGTYMKHKVWLRQPIVALASPVHRARYSTIWDRKRDPARKFKCTTAARGLHRYVGIKKSGKESIPLSTKLAFLEALVLLVHRFREFKSSVTLCLVRGHV